MPLSLRPPLAISLAGLDAAPDPRSLIERVAAYGFRAIALDATLPGLRPRELDRSARRELGALLRRLELRCVGLDLWVPPRHFTDPAHTDRALEAVAAACTLAADLSALAQRGGTDAIVSVALPDECPAPVRLAIEESASRVGARVADHAWPPSESAADPENPVGIGLDPATLLLRDEDPASAASKYASRIVRARLSDSDGSARVAPGQGRLDTDAYAIALATGGISAEVLLDLRGVRRQEASARAALALWATEPL